MTPKLNLNDGSVTPNPAPVVEEDPVDKTLNAWYAELSGMHYTSTAQYEIEGLSVIYEDVVRLRTMLARVDTLMAKGQRLQRKFQNALSAAKALMEDELDKLKSRPERFIAKSYAFQERDACYRSAPELIEARVHIRELERHVSDCETFVKVCTNKYWYLEGSRKDQLLQTSLIRLGFNFREIDLREDKL